jgi:hypothetical protein
LYDDGNIFAKKISKRMKTILLLVFIPFILQACSNGQKENGNRTGGPCNYRDQIYPARLITLEASPDSSTYDAWFEIEDPSGQGKDTINYLRMTNRLITKEQVEKGDIRTNHNYKYVVSTITTGDCDPDMRNIILEEY